MQIDWHNVPPQTWWETAYVVVFGTFICYILTMIGQKTLRPTVVSIYNYVQPVVSVTVSVFAGIGVFKMESGPGCHPCVFSGVCGW